MNTERFFELFFKELQDNKNLYPYYKLTEGSLKQQAFRKEYFLQRLSFIDKNIDKTKDNKIFDCGCGYGTTAIFLAMQGVSTYGVTLEFYYKELENRRKYWKEYGDTSLFECKYDDLFGLQLLENSYDYIILQDTLHHLEPLKNSLELFYRILKPKGKIILVEENGNCLPQVFKLYLQRGNKRVIDYYDEVLGKSLQMGMKIYVHKRLGKNFLKNQALLLRMRIQNIYDYSLRSSTTLQTLPNLFKENPELPKATQC